MKWLVFFPTSSRRTHFFLQSSVFVEKKKQKKNFREKHPSNRDRLRQTDRTRRKRRRAGRGAEWRPTMRKKKQTKPPKRDDDFEKNDREKKHQTKTLGVVYLDDKNSCPKQKARDEEEEKSRRSPRNRRHRRHFFFVRCVMVCEYLVMMCFLIICFFSLLSSVGLMRKKRPKIGQSPKNFR